MNLSLGDFALFVSELNWKPRVAMMPTLLLLATCGTARDYKVGIMTTLGI